MELVDGLIEKAERAFISAEQTLELGHADFAASRAYFGIFYVASALLEVRGIRFRKHGAVIGQFGRTSPGRNCSILRITACSSMQNGYGSTRIIELTRRPNRVS